MRAADDLLARIRPVRGVIDLGTLDWVTPTAIVAVAACAHRASTTGEPLTVRGPFRPDPQGYAARMRLGYVLSELGVEHDLPDVRERDQRDNLVELSRIDTDSDAARLARLVHRKVRDDQSLAKALHGSVGEVGANVPDHATTAGFMAAQTMRRHRTLVVSVADAGPGLLGTLAERGATDHGRAIELATSTVSEFPQPGRGTGLPTTLRLITGVGGSVYIASGDRSIRHHARTRRFAGADYIYPGTIVELRIPLRARRGAQW